MLMHDVVHLVRLHFICIHADLNSTHCKTTSLLVLVTWKLFKFLKMLQVSQA